MRRVACVAAMLITAGAVSAVATADVTRVARSARCQYKLGVELPLTGAASTLGIPDLNGVNAALSYVNRHGGVLGCKLAIVKADEASNPASAATAMQALITDKVYGIIGPQVGTDTLAAEPILARAKNIPACAFSSTVSVISPTAPNMFRCEASDTYSIKAALLFAKTKLHAKSVALLHTDDAYGTEGANQFAGLSRRGATKMNVVASVPLSYSGTDFTADWTRVLAAKPDVVIVWATGSPASIILKNARQLNVKQPIIGGSGMSGASVAAAGSAANGLYSTSLFNPSKPTPEQKVAVKAITAQQGKGYQVTLFDLCAWDSVLLYKQAIENNPNNGLKGFESIKNLVGAEGTYTYTAKKRQGLGVSSVVITQIRNGRAVGVITGAKLLASS